jgi:phosphate butyryltransferase
VNTQIPSTLDAAVLSKMSERGQWGRTCVEGPIDIDCALDFNAAFRKGVRTEVAGRCHIYMTPDIESGYALAQLLTFVGRLPTAGVVVGAICPIILDVTFISDSSFMTELALASLLCESGHEK